MRNVSVYICIYNSRTFTKTNIGAIWLIKGSYRRNPSNIRVSSVFLLVFCNTRVYGAKIGVHLRYENSANVRLGRRGSLKELLGRKSPITATTFGSSGPFAESNNLLL